MYFSHLGIEIFQISFYPILQLKLWIESDIPIKENFQLLLLMGYTINFFLSGAL